MSGDVLAVLAARRRRHREAMMVGFDPGHPKGDVSVVAKQTIISTPRRPGKSVLSKLLNAAELGSIEPYKIWQVANNFEELENFLLQQGPPPESLGIVDNKTATEVKLNMEREAYNRRVRAEMGRLWGS